MSWLDEYTQKKQDEARERAEQQTVAARDANRKLARRKNGFSDELIDRLMIAQDAKCGICKVEIDFNSMHCDHDHETGAPRGLLCRRCNPGIGFLKDSSAQLLAATLYLTIPPVTLLDDASALIVPTEKRRVRRRAWGKNSPAVRQLTLDSPEITNALRVVADYMERDGRLDLSRSDAVKQAILLAAKAIQANARAA